MIFSVRPRAAGAALVVCLGSIPAGCVSIPNVRTAQSMSDASTHAADIGFSAPSADWPADDWWSAYGDAQLNTLIGEALRDSPTLATAQARVLKAESLAQEVGATLRPTLEANGSVETLRQSYNNGIPSAFVPQGYNKTARASLDFNYEFDFFGKNRAALAAATSEAEAARADAAAARLTLSTSVASAYADLAQLYADRDATANAVRIREESASLATQRFTGGLENQGAVAQADAGTASAREQLVALDESIGLTHNRLAALLGAGPDRALVIGRPAINSLKTFGLPTDLKANLLGRRPDVVAARLRAEAAAQRIKQARAAFYPDINLAAYIGQQSLGLSLLTKSGSQIGAIGPAVRLPIFEGGRLRATYRGAAADYDAAVSSYNGAVTQALQDVADVAVSARALHARVIESQKALAASTLAYDVSMRRYKGGVATFLEVLTAEDSLIVNQRLLADLKARAFTLDVALVRALGGGFQAS
jgi:NodT family efflux transporter outer membrane factor (OMF) lipoprotein